MNAQPLLCSPGHRAVLLPMKSGHRARPFSPLSCLPALLALLCVLLASSARADDPRYMGYTVSLHGLYFEFQYNTTDGSGHTVDYYAGSGGTNGYLTVTDTSWSNIATVDHPNTSNDGFSGYWYNNAYLDSHETGSWYDSRQIGVNYYTSSSYAIDYTLGSNGELIASRTDYYSPNSSGSTTEVHTQTINGQTQPIGSITGGEHGIILNGNWYVDGSYYYYAHQVVNGTDYYTSADEIHYELNSNNPPDIVSGHTFVFIESSGSNSRTFTVSYGSNGMGTITGSETGLVYNGSWLFNPAPQSISSLEIATPPNPLFDRYYNVDSTNVNCVRTTEYQSNGALKQTDKLVFIASDGSGASYTITATRSEPNYSYGNPNYGPWSAAASGNDPAIGSIPLVYNPATNVWIGTSSRNGPSIAPSTIYNPDRAVNWSSGTITTQGDVVDTYTAVFNPGNTWEEHWEVKFSGNIVEIANNSYNATAGVSFTVTYPNYSSNYTWGGSGTYYPYNGTYSGVNLRNSPLTTYENIHTSGPTYWVNNFLPLAFAYGSDGGDSDGNSWSSDTFSNAVTGESLTISSGYSASGGTGYNSANLSFEGQTYSGQDLGSLSPYPAPSVSTTAPSTQNLPAAFWVGDANWKSYNVLTGEIFTRAGADSNYYTSSTGRRGAVDSSGVCRIYYPNSGGNGDYYIAIAGRSGAFTFTAANGEEWLGFTLDSSNQVQVSSAPSASLPPAVYAAGYSDNFYYVGSVPDVFANQLDHSVSVYAIRTLDGNSIRILRISDTGVVVIQGGSGIEGVGNYSTQTLLFDSDPNSSPLPTPTYGIAPLNNGKPYVNKAPDRLPASAIINGQLWRFGYKDSNGVAHYFGYYTGQTLDLTPDSQQANHWNVALTNPYGSNASGTYNNFTFTMGGGTTIGSGTTTGGTINPVTHSIAGDIDIFGNVLTLGSLTDDPGTVGLTMSFADSLSTGTSTLTMALARQSSEWAWSHPLEPGSSTLIPSMKLDASHTLRLFRPYSANADDDIVLSPGNKSTFKSDLSVKGTLRVPARGGLSMGAFTNGQQP